MSSRLRTLAPLMFAVNAVAAQSSVAPVPAKVLLRIDAESENLSAISTLAVSPSGILAVYLRQDGVIRLFSPAGKALATAGRKGEGPGEFRGLDGFGWVSDTLWASDPWLKRLTRYLPDGKLLRALPLPQDFEQASDGGIPVRYASSILQSVFPDGSLLFQASLIKPYRSEAAIDNMSDARYAVRVAPDGKVRFVVASDPVNPCMIAEGMESVILPGTFCPLTLRAASTGGSRRVSAIQTIGTDGTGSVKVVAVDERGGMVWARTFKRQLAAVPAAVRDRILGEQSSALRGRVAALMQYYPPAHDIGVGANGSTWIGLYAPKGALREWQRLDATGKQLPSVWLPASAKGLAIDRRGAWAITETEDGAQSITLFEARP